jgi:hypothetical protein
MRLPIVAFLPVLPASCDRRGDCEGKAEYRRERKGESCKEGRAGVLSEDNNETSRQAAV